MLLTVLTLTLRFDDFILVFPVSEKKEKRKRNQQFQTTIIITLTEREREREREGKKNLQAFPWPNLNED